MEATIDLDAEVKPSMKVKAVTAIHTFGTRAQKRAVASGAATRRGIVRVGKGIKNQIMDPYTTTKMLGTLAIMGVTFVGQCYIAYMAALTILLATGSIWLCFAAAFAASFTYQVAVANHVYRAARRYAIHSQNYNTFKDLGDQLVERLDFSGLKEQLAGAGSIFKDLDAWQPRTTAPMDLEDLEIDDDLPEGD